MYNQYNKAFYVCVTYIGTVYVRGFRGGRWWGCREEGEPVTAVQFSVRSRGSKILWGTPYGGLIVVEFCRSWRPRGGSEVHDGRIGEGRPTRFCTSTFRRNRQCGRYCGTGRRASRRSAADIASRGVERAASTKWTPQPRRGGFRKAGTTRMRRAGRGLRAGGIVRRFTHSFNLF